MCKFKSGIITKEGMVYFNEFEDSHSGILEANGIKDETTDAEKKRFARFELVPPNDTDGVFAPFDKWTLQIDEEVVPLWFINKKHGKRCKEACIEWLTERVLIGKQIDTLADKIYWIKNATIQDVRGNATIQDVRGNATIQNVRDNVIIQNVRDNVIIQNVRDNVIIQNVWDNATIQYVWDNATIQYVWDNAIFLKAEEGVK